VKLFNVPSSKVLKVSKKNSSFDEPHLFIIRVLIDARRSDGVAKYAL
jgi:hypothetical protein